MAKFFKVHNDLLHIPRRRTIPGQMKRLVEMMEDHATLATGRSKSTCYKQMQRTGWENIATELNALGPPIKTWDGWRKVCYKSSLNYSISIFNIFRFGMI